jgi:hypothetical protein
MEITAESHRKEAEAISWLSSAKGEVLPTKTDAQLHNLFINFRNTFISNGKE